MKLQYLAASAVLFVGLTSLACSSGNDDIMMGSDSGGSSAGGSGSGGDKPAGGSSATEGGSHASAGSASGGSEAAGGDGNGGSTVSGGTHSGGTSSGGTSSGGTHSGGSAGSNSGGTSSGSGTCQQDADCVSCGYSKAPATAQDCYCINCDYPAMSKTQCAANQAQYDKVCHDVVLPCPAIKCLPPPEPLCEGASSAKPGMCVSTQ